jgi:hypothetical protein
MIFVDDIFFICSIIFSLVRHPSYMILGLLSSTSTEEEPFNYALFTSQATNYSTSRKLPMKEGSSPQLFYQTRQVNHL